MQDHSVVDQNLRGGSAHAHRLGNEAQGFRGLALGEFDHAEHLQSVKMIGPVSEDLGVKLFGIRQAALLVQFQRLREDLRHLDRRWYWHWRHDFPLH
jgi:hypothetical protein